MPRNDEYAILKAFAILEKTPDGPGLDLPGLDVLSVAKGYGCDAARIHDLETLKPASARRPGARTCPPSSRCRSPGRSRRSSDRPVRESDS